MYGATVESLFQTRTEVMGNGRLHFVVTASEPANSDITIQIDLKTTFGVFDAPATSSGTFETLAATNPACIDSLFGAPFSGAKSNQASGFGGLTALQIIQVKFEPLEGIGEIMAFGVLQDLKTRHQVIII
jgi:hypothetical protein